VPTSSARAPRHRPLGPSTCVAPAHRAGRPGPTAVKSAS
jgi:hypothetical protein